MKANKNSIDKIKNQPAINDWETLKYFIKAQNSWADLSELESGVDKHKSSIFKNAKIEEIADMNENILFDKENLCNQVNQPTIKFDHEPIRCTKIISAKQFNGINNINDYITAEEIKVGRHNKNQSLLANISK